MPFPLRLVLTTLLVLLVPLSAGASEIFTGLPEDARADSSISTPEEYFGFDPADRHLRHD